MVIILIPDPCQLSNPPCILLWSTIFRRRTSRRIQTLFANSEKCTVQGSIKLALNVILDLHCIRMIGDIFKCNMFHRVFFMFQIKCYSFIYCVHLVYFNSISYFVWDQITNNFFVGDMWIYKMPFVLICIFPIYVWMIGEVLISLLFTLSKYYDLWNLQH